MRELLLTMVQSSLFYLVFLLGDLVEFPRHTFIQQIFWGGVRYVPRIGLDTGGAVTKSKTKKQKPCLLLWFSAFPPLIWIGGLMGFCWSGFWHYPAAWGQWKPVQSMYTQEENDTDLISLSSDLPYFVQKSAGLSSNSLSHAALALENTEETPHLKDPLW